MGGYDGDDNGRNLFENITCNASNFYISDMIFSEIPIKGHIYDFNESASVPASKCDEPSVFLDEELMLMPFLEDSFGTSNSYDGRVCEDTTRDSVDSSLCISIHHLQSYSQEPDANTLQNWDQADYLDISMFIRTLKDVSYVTPYPWPTNVLRTGTKKRRSTTLVLDLDGMEIYDLVSKHVTMCRCIILYF